MMLVRFQSGAFIMITFRLNIEEGYAMKKKVKKPSQTMKFKEPKLRAPKSYSSRRLTKRIFDWLKDYYRIMIPSILCILLIVAIIFLLLQKKSDATNAVADGEIEQVENPVTDYVVPTVPLEENAYDALNQFATIYYTAMAEGDKLMYEALRDETDEVELIRMEMKSNYIDSYQNITCYTKPGPVENSYVAFVYFEVKFTGVETVAPGLNTMYICTDEEGSLYVGIAAEDEKVTAYIEEIVKQDDVTDLFNKVQVNYTEIVDGSEELKLFLGELTNNLKTDVGEALAKLEAEQAGVKDNTDNPVDSIQKPESGDTTDPGDTEDPGVTVPAVEMVKAKDKVNVRKDATTSSKKLGTASKGEIYVRLEALDNGWSKIQYGNEEAYIMSKYLDVVVDVIGSVKVLENVNVRASASPQATKLGVAYTGEVFDLLEEIGNGWSKIVYNGETAYIKSEYLKRN